MLRTACAIGIVLSAALMVSSGLGYQVERRAGDAFVESGQRALARSEAIEASASCECAQAAVQVRDRAIASISTVGSEASVRNARQHQLALASSAALALLFLACLLLLKRIDSDLQEYRVSAREKT
jgi:hypothetical protein